SKDYSSHARTPNDVTNVTDVTPLPEGSEKLGPEAAEDLDKGLSSYLIGELADWYLSKFEEERLATDTVQQKALDAKLRAVRAERGVFPDFFEIEFERVMEAVCAPLGQRAGS